MIRSTTIDRISSSFIGNDLQLSVPFFSLSLQYQVESSLPRKTRCFNQYGAPSVPQYIFPVNVFGVVHTFLRALIASPRSTKYLFASSQVSSSIIAGTLSPVSSLYMIHSSFGINFRFFVNISMIFTFPPT